ncbi:MAG: protein kinase [Candidatus Aminicenantales bacterium]
MRCPKCQADNPSDSKFCKECAASLTSRSQHQIDLTKTLETSGDEFSPGSVFAQKYRIIEELGRGGMGKVYRVFDREVEEYVALKLIKPEIAADKNTIRRFRNELKVARKISHKNVCRMFDLNREGETCFITMEYVSGEDLKSSLRRMGLLSVEKAVFIAKQVCEGLAEAHRLGVVHRDLKPQNIMIDKQGNARIMDFGIARSIETKGMTDSGSLIGTPEYMSPEQVEGKEVDSRSDIYSLGAILYEMVTGRVPFEGNTPMSVALKHVTAAPPEPRSLNDQIPEETSRVILKCMAKERKDRFQTVEELVQELNTIKMTAPTAERPSSTPKESASGEITVTFKPKRVIIPLVLVCTLAVLGIMAWRIFLSPDLQEKPSFLPSTAQEKSTPSQQTVTQEKPELPPEMPAKQPAEAEEKPEKSLAEARREREVGAELSLGIQAFEAEQYAESIRHMESVLSREPDNHSAQYYLAEAKKGERTRRLKEEIIRRLEMAREGLKEGNYQECLDQSRRVLDLEPGHGEATRLAQEAAEKLTAAQVQALIDSFVSAWNSKTLPDFYRENCSPELYQKNRKDAVLIMSLYESFQTVVSNVTLDLKGIDCIVVQFAGLTAGARARDGRREVIFDGDYEWEMVQLGSRWQIIRIEANKQP